VIFLFYLSGAISGDFASQTEPNNDLFLLLIELDEDENGNFPMQE
jgi:hypothetical protein